MIWVTNEAIRHWFLWLMQPRLKMIGQAVHERPWWLSFTLSSPVGVSVNIKRSSSMDILCLVLRYICSSLLISRYCLNLCVSVVCYYWTLFSVESVGLSFASMSHVYSLQRLWAKLKYPQSTLVSFWNNRLKMTTLLLSLSLSLLLLLLLLLLLILLLLLLSLLSSILLLSSLSLSSSLLSSLSSSLSSSSSSLSLLLPLPLPLLLLLLLLLSWLWLWLWLWLSLCS